MSNQPKGVQVVVFLLVSKKINPKGVPRLTQRCTHSVRAALGRHPSPAAGPPPRGLKSRRSPFGGETRSVLGIKGTRPCTICGLSRTRKPTALSLQGAPNACSLGIRRTRNPGTNLRSPLLTLEKQMKWASTRNETQLLDTSHLHNCPYFTKRNREAVVSSFCQSALMMLNFGCRLTVGGTIPGRCGYVRVMRNQMGKLCGEPYDFQGPGTSVASTT